MNQPSDSSPFDQMHVAPGELSETITPTRAVFGTLGLAIMGVGGLAVAVGYIMLTSSMGEDPLLLLGLGAIIGLCGVGMCFAGYWVFGRGRRRRHYPSEPIARQYPMQYQDRFRPSSDSSPARENQDPHAIRSDRNHDTE